MEAATAMATAPTVEAAATTSVEAAATTAVGASSTAATVTAAMLGKSGDGRANEGKRSDTCKKILEPGGFPHICNPPPKRRLTARTGKPLLTILPLIGTPFQSGSCTDWARNQGDGVRLASMP